MQMSGLSIGNHLRECQRLFGSRLLLLHQESLKVSPRETYNQMAAFVGTRSAFPSRTRFHRYNSRGGHRTNLCRNASLHEALRQRLAPEYEALEEAFISAGVEIPAVVKLRQTRCERPEQLLAVSCPYKTRCRE